MISWEYPPKNIGGLSNHVYHLSQNLKELGHQVHVLTCSEGDVAPKSLDDGVTVHRVVPYSLPSEDFSKWVMHLNFAMVEEAVKLMNTEGKFDLIHCHDWLTLYAGRVLKTAYNIPMLATLHATEHGRNGGIKSELQHYISSTEWLLTYESWKLIVCSDAMREEVASIFKVPQDKMYVIPNGVDLQEHELEEDILDVRDKYANRDEKLVLYVGRHVYEKGIQTLIEAVPDILVKLKNIKFVIAGQGVMTEELKQKVEYLGLKNSVIFPGYLENCEKNKLLRCADAAVFPSYYEPFGIVALEAMAAGCPVVASNTGGLGELVRHRENGMKFMTGSKDSLKDNLLELLSDNDLAKSLSKRAQIDLKATYSWEMVAKQTEKVYEKIKEETKGTNWENEAPKLKKRTGRPRKAVETQDEAAVAKLNDSDVEVKVSKEPSNVKRTRKKS